MCRLLIMINSIERDNHTHRVSHMRMSVHPLDFNEILDIFKDKTRQMQL